MIALASSTKGAQLLVITSAIMTALGAFVYGITSSELLLILLGYFLYGCIGIVVTYHRKCTHNGYQTYSVLTQIGSVLGCMAGTGSPLAWVAIHLNHHLKSDKPGDPHSPYQSGLSMFLLNYEHEVDPNTKWRMRKLVTDKFQQFLHRYYFAVVLAWSLTLYLLGGLYLMIFLHWAPALVTALMSNIVNYIGHKPTWIGGYRTFNLNDHSSNNWLWAIPSWGESWHNNHHRFPRNWTYTQKWWELDISGLIIKLIKT